MTDEQAKKLLMRAKASAKRLGFGSIAEDLAQAVLLRFCEGRGQHQTVDQAVIDAIRAEFGSPRTPGHERRKAVQRPVAGMEAARGIGVEPRDGLDFERLTGMLEERDRAIAKLIYVWGLTEQEIGDLFGISESRISQRHTVIQARLSEALAKEKPRAHASSRTEVRAQEVQGPGFSREAPPSLEEILSGLPEARPILGCESDRPVAEIEPWQMALDYEASFQEWLT